MIAHAPQSDRCANAGGAVCRTSAQEELHRKEGARIHGSVQGPVHQLVDLDQAAFRLLPNVANWFLRKTSKYAVSKSSTHPSGGLTDALDMLFAESLERLGDKLPAFSCDQELTGALIDG
ncbi:hypothetical protein JQK88_29905 [Mesorhizobium caraganae]|uniref:hypothetical protein n=1 Tax=Mesorhizobium caraganae TaxID=483206 RepID=UPI0017833786|nr:hypothetical protein [Mesorhizobium caraganae]MBM2715347.1 hypothetical protein [Mesorhizobium caraganae]